MHIKVIHIYFPAVPRAFGPTLVVNSNHHPGPPLQYQPPEVAKEPKEISQMDINNRRELNQGR